MKIGVTLKKIRKDRKLTQVEFAKICGINQTYLSEIEQGHKIPTIPTLERIAKKLKIPVEVLSFLSLTKDDIDPKKKKSFESIKSATDALIKEFWNI